MFMKKRIHYAWIILFSLCVIRSLAAAGINNTGGIFLSPVASDIGVGVGTLSIYFSISSIATIIFMPIAAKLIRTYSIKTLMLAATIIQAGSFIMLAFMSSVWGWYILSVFMGIGGAILVNLCGPILINRWFLTNTGTALGILMASAGIVGAVMQPLTVNLIANFGWRNTYFLVGIVILVITILLVKVFIKNSPQEKNLQPLSIQQKIKHADVPVTEMKSVTLKTAIKSFSFLGLITFMIAITAFAAFNQHMATFLTSMGFNSSQIGLVLSVGMVGSTIGAILIGIISDKVGIYKTTLAIVGIVIISILFLLFGTGSFVALATGSFLLGLTSIGVPVLAPLLTKELFGNKDYESIYADVMIGPPLATVVLLPLYGFLYDKTGNYFAVICIIGVIVLIGTLGFIFGWRKRKSIMRIRDDGVSL
jgi:MFS family permease